VQQSIESGLAFMPEETSGESMKAPVNTVGQERSGGRGGRRGGPGGGRGRGGGGGGRGREEAPPATEGGGEAPAAESTPPSTETPSE